MGSRKQRGFTLIELVIVVVIVGIIGGIGAILVEQGLRNYDDGQQMDGVTAQARVALYRIDRELRMVRSPSAADLKLTASTNPQTTLAFTTLRGTTYSYQLSGQTLTQTMNQGTPQVLATGVTKFSVQFLQADGSTPATTASTVGYVDVALTVTQGGMEATFNTLVKPRDFS